MKITILRFIARLFFVHVERQYTYPRTIVSAGPDCQPAFILSALYLRSASLPFDWQNTEPSRGIDYLTANIADKFSNFLEGLSKNEKGVPVAKDFPYSEFLHFDDVDNNQSTKDKLTRRTQRFLDTYNTKEISFIYNAKSFSFDTREKCDSFIESVKNFSSVNPDGIHELLIYVTCHIDVRENDANCNYVVAELNKIPCVRSNRYLRDYEGLDYWHMKDEYLKVLGLVGIVPNEGKLKFFIKTRKIFD